MRNNKGAYLLSALISMGLLISLIMIGKGTYSYVLAIVLVCIGLLANLVKLTVD